MVTVGRRQGLRKLFSVDLFTRQFYCIGKKSPHCGIIICLATTASVFTSNPTFNEYAGLDQPDRCEDHYILWLLRELLKNPDGPITIMSIRIDRGMLYNTLQERDQARQPIRVGLVGAGQMGEGLVCQMEMMRGMKAFAGFPRASRSRFRQ